jgi:hypothetical protein
MVIFWNWKYPKASRTVKSGQNRLYGIKDVNFPNFVKVNPQGMYLNVKQHQIVHLGTDLGWYVNLQKAQKLTAEPTVDKDRVYFPIYEPSPANNKCGIGNAILRHMTQNVEIQY